LEPQQYWTIYAPENAYIEQIDVRNGDSLRAGQVVMKMSSPKLQMREQQVQSRIKQTEWQAAASAFDSEQRAHWQSLQMENSAALAERESLEAANERYQPKAPFAGVIRDIAPELAAGQWVSAKEHLATLVVPGKHQVIAYVDEQTAKDLKAGARAYFSSGNGAVNIALRVLRVDADASRTLAEPALANRFGGDISVREKNGVLYPELSIYRVTLQPLDEQTELDTFIWRGHVSIDGVWSPAASRFSRAALALLWREAGF
jgi:putative peptide zinc metalloprotease protein